MEEKKHVDKIRDSAGSMDIGTKEDGAIEEMTKIGERLIIIKERSIYELITADDIDPDRTNPKLAPMISKLIINKGKDSEIVSRTLLTAKNLFQPQYFDNEINHLKALTLSIDLLSELAMLEVEISKYLEQETKENSDYESRRGQKETYQIPTIIQLETQCKTIFQKADHIEQILMDIITSFYPSDGLTKQSHFPSLYEILKNKYGEEDSFCKFINSCLPFMKAIRIIRNGLDHRLSFVTICNYELQTDSSINPPTIELNHKDGKLQKSSLSGFLKIVLENFPIMIETTFAYIAGKNIKKNGFGYQVKEIPLEKRRNKNVKYAMWLPIGQEGLFQQ